MNKPPMKDPKDLTRPYKLCHQVLVISTINFEKQSYVGLVELHIIPQKTDIRTIKINCKQSKIYKVTMNEYYPCIFTYNDPTLEICQEDVKQRNLDLFSNYHLAAVNSTDPTRNNGEVVVQIPSQLFNIVNEGKNLRICIEFGIQEPLGGMHFVVPKGNEEPFINVSVPHMFTYGHENCSRLWFPSIDSYCDPCTWDIEFTVDASLVAVSSGDLTETIYSPDKKKKTYHYQITTPTVAPSIGLAIGPFEIMVDPNMHEVTYFCLPHLRPLLQDTCGFLHESFEFYEELLSSRYPYSCYKQVFVDEAYCDSQSYATMTILDVNLLHSKHIIDQTYITREILAQAVANQFFGTFISMQSWSDAWLTRGISAYLSSQYKKKAFGNNEYRYFINQELNDVVNYEQKHGGIVLDPSSAKVNEGSSHFYFSSKHSHTVSPIYDEIHKKKSHLIIRMLEDRIGRELMLQVFNKLLSLAINASQQKITANTGNAWNNMMLSTSSFTKAIFTVTGKDISTFLEQWVYVGGHPKFHGSFIFNRKRNIVELEIKQLETNFLGIRKYMGPLTVWIQELDGTFKHNLQVEENTTKHDITCHSKSRRNKKKKIPLCTGEEVDMDLSSMDADSPVLWIRIDPDMQLIRQVSLEQPDYQWQYQMRYERDVTAQVQAIEHLKKYPTASTRKALTDTIENEQCYYKVRCMAARCLTSVANDMAINWSGPPAMISQFKKLFGSHSCPNIIKLNNFSNFQLYFLQKEIPLAMSGLRTPHGICPSEVHRFLLDLFKYNDNSKNKFSDNYYRAALIEALGNTVTPGVSAVLTRTGLQQETTESLSQETRLILEEITRYLNLDKLLPCYKHVVTVACLKAIRHLQKMGHLPSNSAFFREYSQYGLFIDVRIAALECLVDITKVEHRKEDLDFIFDLIETDPLPRVRYKILRLMIDNPPIVRKENNPLNTEDIVERLWKLMNNCLPHDAKLRCAVVDLYYTFYGRGRPPCLPIPELSLVVNLKEKKALVNTTNLPESTFDCAGNKEMSQIERSSPVNITKFDDSDMESPPVKKVRMSTDGPISSLLYESSPKNAEVDGLLEQEIEEDRPPTPISSFSPEHSSPILVKEEHEPSPTLSDSVPSPASRTCDITSTDRSIPDQSIGDSLNQNRHESVSETFIGSSSVDTPSISPRININTSVANFIPTSLSEPLRVPFMKEFKEKDKEKKREKEKDEFGHKLHKEKKKKKKKHKHKHKHKHHHGDKEKHSSITSDGGSTNQDRLGSP